ncbi:MAG: hypothetical protein A3I73_05615 [Omnitrophica bacterium RIFCSPLOWO2_02_FULL_45_16]|nr:MAG: hypothetical protein A3C51_00135 [Omnitrophica bacterium RIFCSPHIGHO2_02_FULL_46_20]OGW93247.1 MAG: hypothetical protein A3G36_01250 [Omnitrophica bacterium RIFCSPLOWO2_12_FULL_45_13]OGW93362.1 MAG: hypothetical protein A3K16_00235 [Omnitrophica bacterium RIFCSPLOWO2_01_FULL_45_24]OGX00402.1 MAG: hypothetical protein A3I73_05615 [Omnitrophica bacterium RIFCSPLOWO2_02_FULL_45_16]
MKEIETEGGRIIVDETVDAVGLFCPMPVVKLKLEMEKLEPGNIVELLADDAGVLEDLPAWCRETGNILLSLKKNEEGVFTAYVKKGQ